jgi:hypothetical protein
MIPSLHRTARHLNAIFERMKTGTINGRVVLED